MKSVGGEGRIKNSTRQHVTRVRFMEEAVKESHYVCSNCFTSLRLTKQPHCLQWEAAAFLLKGGRPEWAPPGMSPSPVMIMGENTS